MKHDNDTIVRDICIATGAVTAACIASLATTGKQENGSRKPNSL